MQLEDFKIAALRVFYDIVNSDGIIDDNEILFLEKLKEKYGVLYSDGTENIELVTKAHQITFVGALGQLKEWKKEHELDENGKRLHKNVLPKYTTDNLYSDALNLAQCDGDCSETEALLLIALWYILDDDNIDNEVAIGVACKTKTLKFSRSEIVYAEHQYEDCNDELQDAIRMSLIKSKLKLIGFDFIYIPDVVKFLSRKNEGARVQDSDEYESTNSMLSKMMMFSHPMFLQTPNDSKRFTEELIQVTTADFVNDYLLENNENPEIVPSIVIKLKTSRIPAKSKSGIIQYEKYLNFLLISIENDVLSTVEQFIDRYLGLIKVVNPSFTLYNNERVSCKGFHKTLMDYVVYRSIVPRVSKVVFDLSRGKKKYLIFDGITEISMPPARFFLYMIIVAMSKQIGVICKTYDNARQKEQNYLHERFDANKLQINYQQVGTYISKIKDDIDRALFIDNKGLFMPYKKKYDDDVDKLEETYRVKAPLDMFYVRKSKTEELPLEQYIQMLQSEC